MLSFDRQTQFETWLRQCPIEPQRLSYGVERKLDGLTITCSWTLPALTSNDSTAQACGAGASCSHADHAEPAKVDASAELSETLARMERLKAAMPPEALAMVTQMADDGSRPTGGSALASMLLQRGAASGDTSAKAVRETLGAMGLAIPKPPGQPLE